MTSHGTGQPRTYAALRQLLIPSGAALCFGLKTRAKTDPTPTPTKKKVTAEYRSYSLLIAPSIAPRSIVPARFEAANHSVGCKNRATFPTSFVFQLIPDSVGTPARNFDCSKRQKFSLLRTKENTGLRWICLVASLKEL
jgi:hypothetical protein